MNKVNDEARAHLAWLIYCFTQGYGNPADRAVISNWFNDEPDTLTESDIKTREDLLGMADEILKTFKQEYDLKSDVASGPEFSSEEDKAAVIHVTTEGCPLARSHGVGSQRIESTGDYNRLVESLDEIYGSNIRDFGCQYRVERIG